MKPDADYFLKLAAIESREDRHLVPRDSWTERDGRAQRQHDKERRARRAKLIADMDRPLVVPPSLPPMTFSLHDRTRDRERERRVAANRALQKAGLLRSRRW